MQSFTFDTIIGVALDREQHGATKDDFRIALFRLFLEPAKLPVDGWSMSVNSRSGTCTFGDVFGPTIVNLYLPASSFESYKNALAGNPKFFDRP